MVVGDGCVCTCVCVYVLIHVCVYECVDEGALDALVILAGSRTHWDSRNGLVLSVPGLSFSVAQPPTAFVCSDMVTTIAHRSIPDEIIADEVYEGNLAKIGPLTAATMTPMMLYYLKS